MSTKKRILLVWWYDRADLWKPFEKLKKNFDYSLLFYKFKEEEQKSLPYDTYFWTEFVSPFEIIDQIKPDKVIFFGVVSHYTIALNYVCKKFGIKTYQIEHGVRANLKEALKIENVNKIEEKKEENQVILSSNKLHPVLFFLRTFSIRDLMVLPNFVKIFYLLRINKRYKALSSLKFKERLPNKYIVFTKWLGTIYRERDGALDEQMIPIGNYFFDEYFRELPEVFPEPTEEYYLLIDQPIYEVYEEIDERARELFYKKLALFSKKNDAVLIVKLHPSDFDNNDLPVMDNLRYLKEGNNLELIIQSKGAFGFFSTLLIPAIYHKPTVLFNVRSLQMLLDWKEFGVIELLDFMNFEPEDINFERIGADEASHRLFVEKYLYKADGKALVRLKNELDS